MEEDNTPQKTIQEILDEERAKSKLHTLSEKAIRQMLVMEERKNDPDAWDQFLERTSKSHTGKTTPENVKQKMAATKAGKARPDGFSGKMAQSKTKYVYVTPIGIFVSRKELLLAYPEFTPAKLQYLCKKLLDGFSRRPKDD